MKTVYMGTPDFAVAPLEAIIKAGHQVMAVVTQCGAIRHPGIPAGKNKRTGGCE